jgi:hypothetical protein
MQFDQLKRRGYWHRKKPREIGTSCTQSVKRRLSLTLGFVIRSRLIQSPRRCARARRRHVDTKRLCGRTLYPAGPAAILHRPDPIMIVAEPSLVVELA